MWKNKEKPKVIYLPFVFFIGVFLVGASIVYAPSGGGDAEVMAELAEILSNPPKDWISGSDPCSSKWTGVLCSGSRITGINLRGRILIGTLPSSLSFLTAMQSLFLPGFIPTIFVLLVCITGLAYFILCRKTCYGEGSDDKNIISIQDLRKATNNFSEDNILGRGRFGVVYKGVLSNGMIVAVKRCVLDMWSIKGVVEFKAEIDFIRKARHRNLVSLVGYCEHDQERLLVNEYMPEGTLAQHLFDREGSRYCPLTWKQRLTIALDVANAMEYLHYFFIKQVIHMNLKPSNILLDKDLRGNVSDFGMLKLPEDNEKSMTTRLPGTFGYMALDYAIKNSCKIDVYAFGVILLELMTSRKVLDDSVPDEDVNLVAAFRRIHPKDTAGLENFIDSSIFNDEESRGCIADLAKIAHQCTSSDPKSRPEMRNVAIMLSLIADRWCPGSNYGDHSDAGDSSVSLL